MIDSREKMLERVRAILAKHIGNGCTEGEAMAALVKAQEPMAAYDGHTEETEGAVIREDMSDDPYQIKRQLAYHIGSFTRCKTCHYSGQNRQAFCGVESSIAFANWFSEMLAAFVLRELKAHQAQRCAQGRPSPRIVSSSFVLGCVSRIGDRLRELTPLAPVSGTGNALAVSRNALIEEVMKKAGIKLRKASSRSRRVDTASYGAGKTAGNAARFDRPVSTAGGAPRLGRCS